MEGTILRDRPAAAALLALLLLSFWVAATGLRREAEEDIPGGRTGGRGLFILGKSKRVVKSEGGEVRLVSGYRWKGNPNPMHIGFIHMEPNTLFIPQYVDSNIVFFVRTGEARIGWIDEKDKTAERKLKAGDIDNIPAGSTFYLVNTGKELLHIICSIDSSESLGYRSFQSFFIGGGTSVLRGFDDRTLTAAFNVTMEELLPFLKRQVNGPIIYWRNTTIDHPRPRTLASQIEEEDSSVSWLWQRVLDFIMEADDNDTETISSTSSYNLYNTNPSFKNQYGWSIAVDEHDYAPLKHSGIGIYLVNLSAGAMLAPHVNPTATEYGVVLQGSGTIQVVFPNGTAAMNAEVREGDVFWIPRFFPFCQVAAVDGTMEFFGFTTSARRNRPQFLAGARSMLGSMSGPELAAGLGVSEERLRRLVKAQREEIILPSWEEERVRKDGKFEQDAFSMKRGFAFA